MTAQNISTALRRVREIFVRRPTVAFVTDAAAIARWDRDLRVVSRHANGSEFVTDMPTELGGTGAEVTPGWFLRAGIAACLATRIAMEAAERGVVLEELEVRAESNSDVRGLFGMRDETGRPVSAGPSQMKIEVRARAGNIDTEVLRALILECHRNSPVSAAIENGVPASLHVDIRSQ